MFTSDYFVKFAFKTTRICIVITKERYLTKEARVLQVKSTLVIHVITYIKVFEPRHDTSNNVVCATNKGSDQPYLSLCLLHIFYDY